MIKTFVGWLTCLLLIMMMILAGMGTPSYAETKTAFEGEFVYVLEDRSTASNRIHGYRVDGASGQLTSLGDPVETGFAGDDNGNAYVQRLAFHAGTHRLFVLNDGTSNLLSVYRMDTSTGALTTELTAGLGIGEWGCVAVHPSGSPVVVGGVVAEGSGIAGRIASFMIDASGITPAPSSPVTAGAAIPYSCRFSQDGHYFYAGGYGETEIAGFQVDPASGSLTPLAGSPFNSGVNNPVAYATDNEGRLFVADSAHRNGPLHVYTTTNGVPTAVNNGPFASGMNNSNDYIYDGLLHPAGYYLGVTFSTRIGVYSVKGQGADTTLTPVTGSPFSAGGNMLAQNRDGTLLFAANFIGGIFTLTLDPNTGEISMLSSVDVEDDAPLTILSGMAYAAAPLPPAKPAGYLYALRTDTSGNHIYGYQVDAKTGRLTLLDGFPFATGGTGGVIASREGLSFDPVYNRLYALNTGDTTLSAFAIDLATGNLSPLPGSPFALGDAIWSCVTVHPTGSPVIVGGIAQIGSTGRLLSFQASASGLVAASGNPLQVGGTTAKSCSFSTDGSYLYVAGPDIGAYQVDSSTGTLTAVAGSPFFSGAGDPLGLAVDHANRLFLTESWVAPDVSANYAFTLQEGKPTAVTGNPSTWNLDTHASDTLMHPDGYYIVANSFGLQDDWLGSSLSIFQVTGSGATTSFALIFRDPGVEQPVPIGSAGLSALAINHTGSMLFTDNELGSFLQSFAFDPSMRIFRGLSRLPQGALGSASASTAGLAFVPLLPDLTLSMSSTSSFRDQADVSYTLQVANQSTVTTTTPITVVDDLPAGSRFLAATGTGWSCRSDQYQMTCTHPGPLAAGAALPDLILTVALAADLIAPPQNQARVFLAEEVATRNNQASYTPSPTDQTIQFAPLAARFLDESPLTLTATSSSGLPVQFSSTTAAICTVDGALATLHTVGTCTIVASQLGDWAFTPATEVVRQFLVTGRADVSRQLFLPMVVR